LKEGCYHSSFYPQNWYKNNIANKMEEILMAKIPQYLKERRKYLLKKLVAVQNVIDAHEQEPVVLKVVKTKQ